MRYHQLTQEKRYQIYTLKQVGYTMTDIAKVVKVHKSTISRELKRNKGQKGYRAKQAHNLYKQREINKYKKQNLQDFQKEYIVEKLKLYWSPEQISGRMRVDKIESISHESIYQYILKDKRNDGTLYQYLRHKNKRYKKRYGSNERRGNILNKVSIEDRPNIVNKKNRIGDLEIDLIIGKNHKQALVTVVDIHSKFTIAKKVPNKKANIVSAALIEMILPIKNWVHTITSDNGKEFAYHERVSNSLQCDYYFCHPYASYERGLNENTNGLIRQFFPKGSEFTNISNEDVAKVQNNLNYRPRKSLGYKTPYEVFFAKIYELENSA